MAMWLWAGGQRACYEAAFDSKQMFIYLECCLIEVIWEALEKEAGRLLNFIFLAHCRPTNVEGAKEINDRDKIMEERVTKVI